MIDQENFKAVSRQITLIKLLSIIKMSATVVLAPTSAQYFLALPQNWILKGNGMASDRNEWNTYTLRQWNAPAIDQFRSYFFYKVGTKY